MNIIDIAPIDQALKEIPRGLRASSSAWSGALETMTPRAWANVRLFLLGARSEAAPEHRSDYDFVLGIAAMHMAESVRSGRAKA